MNQQMQIAPPGLTPIQYARERGWTIEWVYRLVREGKLPSVRVFGRIFILPEERPESTR